MEELCALPASGEAHVRNIYLPPVKSVEIEDAGAWLVTTSASHRRMSLMPAKSATAPIRATAKNAARSGTVVDVTHGE